VPSEIAHQSFGLITGADRERAQAFGLIEERDHACSRHDVAPPTGVSFGRELQVALDSSRDVDRERFDAERIDNELRVGETRWR